MDKQLKKLAWLGACVALGVCAQQILDQVIATAPGRSGFGFSRTITIDHTKVPNTDQTSFPVSFSGTYTYLKTVGNGGNVQNANGYDIVFTSDSGGSTPLDFEIESYNASTGAVAFWVRLPTVSHTSDTVFYLWYGNSGISTSQENATAVWDSDYIGVWHGHITGSGPWTSKDSTGHGHDGTTSGGSPATTSGTIDGAADVGINGDGSRALLMNSFSDLFDGSNHLWTIEAWLQNFQADTSSARSALGMNTSTGAAIVLNFGTNGATHNLIQLFYVPGTWFSSPFMKVECGSQTISNGTYYHVVIVMDMANTANGAIYLNGGSNVGTQSASGTPGSVFSALGSSMWQGFFVTDVTHFGGRIDELRFSKSIRSGDWATASYNNQSSPSTFYAVGSAVPH